MENLNVILSLLFFLGVGSSVIHYAGARKTRAFAKSLESKNTVNKVQDKY